MNHRSIPPPGATDPEFEKWKPWTPREAAEALKHVAAPWCVVAGWAIDLFLGEHGRHHDDLEVAVPVDRFEEIVDALSSFEWFVAGGINDEGMVWPLRGAEETLVDHHQTWVKDPVTGYWRMDVFREPSRRGQWVSRRHSDITLPYGELILRTDDGIPYARPEVVLLFKAKHTRPKDQEDFEAVLPRLTSIERDRLAGWLELIHPEHEWITALR